MRKSLLSIVTASVLLAGVGLAMAQTSTSTTTKTWTNDQGTTIREYSTTKKYNSYNDPNLKPDVGMALPGTITVYVKGRSPSRMRTRLCELCHTITMD